MAGLSNIPLGEDLGVNIHFDDDCDATPSSDVDYGATKLYAILAINGMAAEDAYLKLYNKAKPVVGTDAPDEEYLVPANDYHLFVCPAGLSFDNLSFAACTAGGTAASTDPTTPIDVYLVAIPS
jgi:hypothetical protein